MIPSELAGQLRITVPVLSQVCDALKIPMPGDDGFSSQQVLTISLFVEQKRDARQQESNPLSQGPRDSISKTVVSDDANILQDFQIVSAPLGSPSAGAAPPVSKRMAGSLAGAASPAELVVGKYRLQHSLGSGGMGQVWLARDTVADIDVALKVLPEAFRANPDEQARLKRSFQVVQALPPHKSICQLRDLQQDQALGYYLVMEYIDGVTLSKYRYEYEQRYGDFPLSELIRVLELVADALDYAHDRKLIHRDIKPSNVLISRDGLQLRVIDFQLAWEIRTTSSRINTGEKVDNAGTYPYMAPELWRGQRASPKSDQYALAMLTFELLDGRLPFEASDQASWAIIVTNPDTRIPEIEGVPAYTQAALARALASDPTKRFDSCRQFVEALAGQESRETENFVRWKATDAARQWVANQTGTWTHQDWVQLLEGLRRSEFWPMREADIGGLLDEVRKDMAVNQGQFPPATFPQAETLPGQGSATEDPLGTQIYVAGYPSLSDQLLVAEREYHRQTQLLNEVEDGIHPILTAGRERLRALQQSFDALNKEHEQRLPQAAPGVLEAITEAIGRDPQIPLSKLCEIPDAPRQEDLFEYVQRLKRVLAARKELEAAQRQALVDRQTFSEKIRQEVDQTQARLFHLRESDFETVCRSLFSRGASAKTAFPTELWIQELSNIRVRRYHWSDQELLAKAERAHVTWQDDIGFEAAIRAGTKDAVYQYKSLFPNGQHHRKADATIQSLDEEELWKAYSTKQDHDSCRAYLGRISVSPRRREVEARLNSVIRLMKARDAMIGAVIGTLFFSFLGLVCAILPVAGPIWAVILVCSYAFED